MIRLLFIFTLLSCTAPHSLAQLRIVSYNTATSGENFSPAEPRDGISTVLDAIGKEAVNDIAKPIDVLLLQEQASVNTTTQAFANLLNNIYGEDVYSRGRVNGGTNGGGRMGIVYNTKTVELISERAFGQLSSTAQARRTLRYQLRPLGYDDRSDFYAYVNHYKASFSQTDALRRNVEATELRRNSDALGDGVNAIYAGDYNIQSCNEDMFQTLIAPGAGQAVDPMANFAADCIWNNNTSLRQLHTQSPSDGTGAGLVAGGMDDRFDFQLVTNNLIDEEGLSLIPGSYRAFGNNGTHRLNQSVNAGENTAATQPVLNALASASDHLPVVADYQLPAIMQVELGEIPSRVRRDAPLQLEVRVSNNAPVNHAIGADELDFELKLDVIGKPSTIRTGTINAATPADVTLLDLPTDFASLIAFGVGATTQSQGAMNASFFEPGAYTVVNPSIGSLEVDNTTTTQTIDLGIVPISALPQAFSFSIYNRAVNRSAAMDLDAVVWSTELDNFSSTLEPFRDLAPGSQQDFTVALNQSNIGELSNKLTLTISDEDTVFGAVDSQLTIHFSARVALTGDANLDDRVGFDDFLVLSASFGMQETDWRSGNFNGDDSTDFADFLSLSANFGTEASLATVPEPTAGTTAIALLLLTFCGVAGNFTRTERRN